jgi:hypothetical protein
MLIMTLSYTQKTGDNSLIQAYVRFILACSHNRMAEPHIVRPA